MIPSLTSPQCAPVCSSPAASIQVSCRCRQTTPCGAAGSGVNKAVERRPVVSAVTILLLDVFQQDRVARLPDGARLTNLDGEVRRRAAAGRAQPFDDRAHGRAASPSGVDHAEIRREAHARSARNPASPVAAEPRDEEGMQRADIVRRSSADRRRPSRDLVEIVFHDRAVPALPVALERRTFARRPCRRASTASISRAVRRR